MTELIPVVWTLRNEALLPVAVAAFGEAARTLLRSCLVRDDDQLGLLRGVCVERLAMHKSTSGQAGQDINTRGIILVGDADLLPWVDGAFYFGHDGDAPSLLLPSALEPSVPLPLFESALRRRLISTSPSALAPPLLIWPHETLVVSLATARPLDRQRAEEWLFAHESSGSLRDEATLTDGTDQLGTLHEGGLHE